LQGDDDALDVASGPPLRAPRKLLPDAAVCKKVSRLAESIRAHLKEILTRNRISLKVFGGDDVHIPVGKRGHDSGETNDLAS
jgi:hypothetical protein